MHFDSNDEIISNSIFTGPNIHKYPQNKHHVKTTNFTKSHKQKSKYSKLQNQ